MFNRGAIYINMPKAALTGTIGSGKSTAAKIFASLGAVVVDADVLAREVVEPGSEGLKLISQTFGAEFLLPDGSLDRKKMGTLVFSEPDARRKLESIVHPMIRKKFLEQLGDFDHRFSKEPSKLFLYVVPLFFESNNTYAEIEKIICVSAAPEICISRIMSRDNISKEQAMARLSTQLPIAIKESKSDYVIRNDSSLSALEGQVEQIFKLLTSPQEKSQ